MTPYSVLVTGANRGIGLGLVKQFLKNKEVQHVIDTSRGSSTSNELKEISDKRLSLLKLDVTSDESINALYPQVEEFVGDRGLNVLLNNAGIFVKYSTNQKPDRAALIKNFVTNAAGVAVLTQVTDTFDGIIDNLALNVKNFRFWYFSDIPPLRKTAALTASDELSIDRAAILNISAGIASITNNTSGSGHNGMLADRISKTALNALMRTVAIDLFRDHILAGNFCPGWVQTQMGGKKATSTVEEATEVLVRSFSKLGKEHTGGFFNGDLSPISF